MRLVRDPTIRIFKTLNTAAVTTMVFQLATAPGDAPENPRFDLNIEIVHLPGQMPYAENNIFWSFNPYHSPQKNHPANMTE